MFEEKRATFPGEGFDYRAEEISGYAYYFDAFVLTLRSGNTVRLRTDDPEAFFSWLQANKIKVNNSYVRHAIEPNHSLAYLMEPPLS